MAWCPKNTRSRSGVDRLLENPDTMMTLFFDNITLARGEGSTHYKKLIPFICLSLLLLFSGCITPGIPNNKHGMDVLKERILVPHVHTTEGPKSERPPSSAPVPNRPISLQEAVAIALKNNHTLRQAFTDMHIARDDRDIARSLFLPYLSATYAYDRSDRQRAMVDPENPLMPPFYFSENEFRRTEIKLMMTIWDFGRSLGTYNQANLGHDIADLVYKRTRQQVIFQVVNAYFNVLRAERAKVIAEESLTQARQHVKTAVSFERYGIVDMNDVLRARVQVAEVRQMLIKAKNRVELATSILNSALGVNVNLPTRVIDDTRIIPFSLSLSDCLQLAIEHRPEFKVIQKAIRIEEEGIKASRAGHFPTIYVAGSYNWNDDDYQKFADSSGTLHNDNLSGEIGIRIDLFTGGRTTAEVRKAKRKLTKSEEKAKQVCDGISLQVKAALLAIQEARDRIGLAKGAVAQAEENLRLINNKYRENVVTSTDVVDAETLLTRNKQNYYTALYDYIVAIAQLESAIGKRIPTSEKAA
ncbi:hypothetical protein ES703_108368 [subsurface metagenome]